MKEYTAGRNEAGQRLDKFLFKILPEAGRGFLCKMMRKKNITLNGGKCEGNERLSEGDVVRVWFSDETLEKFSGEKAGRAGRADKETQAAPGGIGKDPLRDLILFEGTEVLLFSKPRGLLSQKAAPGDISANEHLIRHLLMNGSLTEEQLRTFRPAVVNRLDRNTGGILIAGKTLPALQILSELLKKREIEKYYLTGVAGQITEASEIRGFLRKDPSSNRVLVVKEPASEEDREIRTGIEPLCVLPDRTLLRIHLITGRTHQIRAHLASAGHPVLGDPKYGDRALNERLRREAGLRFQLLHAFELRFPENGQLPEEVRGKVFRDKVPEMFEKLFPDGWKEKSLKAGAGSPDQRPGAERN